MDYLTNNENLVELFNYDKNSEEYQKYIVYLNFYFSNPGKKDKYTRSMENGNYVLTDNKSKKKIIIEPAKYINLNILFNQLEVFNNIVLEKVSLIIEKTSNFTNEDRKEFNHLKEKYSLFMKKIKEIDVINKTYYDEYEKNLKERLELTIKLAKYYMDRTYIYKDISVMIEKSFKNELINIYKKNNKQLPSIEEINKIAKKNEIPSKEIENWFKWIDNSCKYILTKSDLYKLNDLIKKNKEDFNNKNEFMLIKKPNIIL